MIKLKELLLQEYVDSDVVKLQQYLNSTPEQKVAELVGMIGYKQIIDEYFIKHRGLYPKEINWNAGKDGVDITQLYKQTLEFRKWDKLKSGNPVLYSEMVKWFSGMIEVGGMDFYNFMNNFGIETAMIPSWFFLSQPTLVKNQWLVHGTSQLDAAFMAKQGFIRGVKDWTKLGLTTWFDGKSAEKKLGGYNFAYTVEDFAGYGLDGYTVKYGDGTILVFRASGIRSFHSADDEMQTIFNGKTATDIVPIYDKMGSLRIYSKKRKELITFSNHMDAVNWVVNNYDQYRKAIGWEKPRK